MHPWYIKDAAMLSIGFAELDILPYFLLMKFSNVPYQRSLQYEMSNFVYHALCLLVSNLKFHVSNSKKRVFTPYESCRRNFVSQNAKALAPFLSIPLSQAGPSYAAPFLCSPLPLHLPLFLILCFCTVSVREWKWERTNICSLLPFTHSAGCR